MISVKIGNCEDFIPRIVELAGIVYKSSDVSPYHRYRGLYVICPHSFITAYDETGELVGYIIATPVDPQYFERTTRLSFEERDFYSSICKPYTTGRNKLYLFSIVVEPTHSQRVQILGALARGFVRLLRVLAERGVIVNEVSALALSESGKKICRGIDMEEVGTNPKGTVFVHRNFPKVYLEKSLREGAMSRLVRPV